MLSQSVEYALRAACFLAERSPEPQTTGRIAKATKVPAAYLSKILQQLGRAGIVRSQRGVNCGSRDQSWASRNCVPEPESSINGRIHD